MITMKLGEMVEDFDLYPRDNVSSTHVREIADALEAGEAMPPIMIDQKSKAIVDGFHRRRAQIRLYGEDHEVEVITKRYKDKQQLFEDAVRRNANHGLRLDKHDRATALVKAEALGIDVTAIGAILHMNVNKTEDLKASRTARTNGSTLVLKNTTKHLAGQKVSKKQAEGNRKAQGSSQAFMIGQVINLIENDLLDTSDAIAIAKLKELARLLEGMEL